MEMEIEEEKGERNGEAWWMNRDVLALGRSLVRLGT